ncbi:hypothetical protein CJU89_4841 [Yarrowia sp. B02]|nr:hypothetical protein CJU89_4841 [Yarrowia sp. B02]
MVLEENALLGTTEYSVMIHGDWLADKIQKTLQKLRSRRLGGKKAMDVVTEVLQNPLVRGSVSNKNFFACHTAVYRWWKSFPEVLIIEDSTVLKTRGGAKHRLLNFSVLDSHSIPFPVAGCAVRHREDKPGYVFAFQELRKVMEEFGIAEPTYVQTNSECAEFEKWCKEAFPKSVVYVDNRHARTAEAKEVLEAMPSEGMENAKGAYLRWAAIVEETELRMFKNEQNFEYRKPFFAEMEKRLVSWAKPFQTKPMSEYVNDTEYKFENLYNELEMVRLLLKDFVTAYETLQVKHGVEEAFASAELDDFYENVMHKISHVIAGRPGEENHRGLILCPPGLSLRSRSCHDEVSGQKAVSQRLPSPLAQHLCGVGSG